jgi:RND family efflux transporter MFP subunit
MRCLRGDGNRRKTGLKGERDSDLSSEPIANCMKKRTLLIGVTALLAVGAGAWSWNGAPPEKASAQSAGSKERSVPVTLATAAKRSIPIRLEALGTVTTIASVAVKPRIDSAITEVKFADGGRVKQGDILFLLDSRAIEAQIQQVEGNIARDRAQIEGAERDVRRYTELVAKNATPVVNLDNAKTQAGAFAGALKADLAALENLKVQLSYCTIRAPITGRISMASAKIGNIVRQADIAPLATINQIAPIYVSFTVPQVNLPDVRAALAAETATLDAIIPGSGARVSGQVTMIENTVDPATGMVTIRATMPNEKELLWPGTLVNTSLTLRIEERVAVPAAAIQNSQSGTFVFVVKENAAVVRPVKVERTVEGLSVIESGLNEGDVVVTDGQLQLSNGTKVTPRGKADS